MDTKTSFIGQISDSISRLIHPKNFYNPRHAIPNIVVGIIYQEEGSYSIAILLQERLNAMKQTSNEKS